MREACVPGRRFWIREGFASEEVQLPKKKREKEGPMGGVVEWVWTVQGWGGEEVQ